jgi:hypothetical protein
VRRLQFLAPIEMSLVRSPNVTNISCQFDRTDRAAMGADLLTKALHSTKDESDKLAGPVGRHVTAAVAVSTMSFDSLRGHLASARDMRKKQIGCLRRSAGDNDLQVDELSWRGLLDSARRRLSVESGACAEGCAARVVSVRSPFAGTRSTPERREVTGDSPVNSRPWSRDLG